MLGRGESASINFSDAGNRRPAADGVRDSRQPRLEEAPRVPRSSNVLQLAGMALPRSSEKLE